MQFLRTVFWVVLAVIVVVFCIHNTHQAKIFLWDDLYWGPPMWAVVLAAFLLGLIPPWLLHRVTRWTMGRKLEAANRQLVETRNVIDPVPMIAPAAQLPPGAVPIAPPPGVG